jgi:Holliday junction resolvasome RuvABC ATP-dependent DNA helicase subunit
MHAALNPCLRVMFVNNIHDLDEDNRNALFATALDYNLQLLIHETSNDKEIGIVIMD